MVPAGPVLAVLGAGAPVPIGAGVVELTKIGVLIGAGGTTLVPASGTETGAVPIGTGTEATGVV